MNRNVMIGTWAWGAGYNGSGDVFGKRYEESSLKETFEEAVRMGLTKWDTAAVYGMGSCEKLLGKFPRDFELMPGERYMVVGHKMSDEIQVYAFDRGNCSLTPVGAAIPCWRPLCFKFGIIRP